MAVVQISPQAVVAPRIITGPAGRDALVTPGPNRYDGPAEGSVTIPVPPAPAALVVTENPAST